MEHEPVENDKGTEVSAATRRAILLGGAVGLAGLVADSVISAQPASATEGGNVLIGKDNTGATARTGVFYTGNTVVGVLADEANLYGVQGQDNSTGGGTGVYGKSTNGTGVLGQSTNGMGVAGIGGSNAYGVSGHGDIGVYGFGTKGGYGYGVYGQGDVIGVFGFGTSYGVYGTDGEGSSNIAVAAVLTNAANASPALQADTVGTGNAVEATIDNAANSAAAVSASTNGTGNAVSGSITNSGSIAAAIVGKTTGKGPGVNGAATNAAGIGVLGQGTTGATGVEGESDTGTGVLAKSTSGDALKVVGKVAFSRSGLATIGATKKSVTVTLAGVTTSSMVIATLQTAAGAIAVANAVPGTRSFTINLTAAPSSSVKVAWFVIG